MTLPYVLPRPPPVPALLPFRNPVEEDLMKFWNASPTTGIAAIWSGSGANIELRITGCRPLPYGVFWLWLSPLAVPARMDLRFGPIFVSLWACFPKSTKMLSSSGPYFAESAADKEMRPSSNMGKNSAAGEVGT